MDRKKYFLIIRVICYILIGVLIYYFYLKGSVPREEFCNFNSDCTMKYNVKVNGLCSAGCFNLGAVTDKECNYQMKWGLMVNNCICKNHKCQ